MTGWCHVRFESMMSCEVTVTSALRECVWKTDSRKRHRKTSTRPKPDYRNAFIVAFTSLLRGLHGAIARLLIGICCSPSRFVLTRLWFSCCDTPLFVLMRRFVPSLSSSCCDITLAFMFRVNVVSLLLVLLLRHNVRLAFTLRHRFPVCDNARLTFS